MAEYIEREAVLRRMQKIATEAWKMRIKANVETVWNEAQDVLRFFPAADVRPVVTCAECKWWTKQEASLQGRCELLQMYPTGAWFCANGKREES